MIGSRYTKELIDDYVKQGFWDPTLLLSDLCERAARNYPEKEAVIDSRSRLTWKEVNQRIDQIARGLLDLGLKRDDVLSTQLVNCVEYFLLFFACEKAGIIVSNAQPTFRHAEMEPILRQTNSKGIIIMSKFRDFDYFGMAKELQAELPELRHIIVVGDDVPQGAVSLTELMNRNLEDKYPPQYLQRIRFKPWEVTRIFNTSGTTGTPKCIEWPLAPRIHTGRVVAKRLQLDQSDVILAGWNLASGGTTRLAEVGIPMVGAKLVNIEHFTPEETCELAERERVTILALVPAQMARLLDYPDLGRYDLSSLRMLFTGTQLLSYELGVKAEEALRCPIGVLYGSGDTGLMCSTTIADSREVRLATVGLPLDGDEVKIMDNEGNPLPPGEIGEVCVTGPTMVSGYYGNQEMTRELWQDGWFRTGDAGKVDEQGHVILLGRKRDVIIRGGQNIYPSEIENMLILHPKVEDVAIVRMPDPVMGQRQCAYVVPKPGQTFEFEEMASFLKSKKIAPYKLPERLEIRDELPLVPAGQKVDRDRLEEDIADKLKLEGKI